MSLKLDNTIKACTPKDGVVSKAVAYLYSPIADGVNANALTIELNGQWVKRSADRPVFLYASGDKSGEWELLADVSEKYFVENFDFVE